MSQHFVMHRFRAAVALVYLQGQVDVKMQSGFGLGQHEANTDKTVDFKGGHILNSIFAYLLKLIA